MTNSVFMTRGSGFVGQNMVPKLLNTGYKVYALARSGNSLEKVETAGAIGVLGNLSDLQNAQQALEKCQIVVHCAA